MKQAHITITGFVQGVGYRKFVRHSARKLGLAGWVRNVTDGSVEALISGEEATIIILIEKCKKGPYLSHVDNIHIEWDEVQELFTEFSVRHD